MSTNSLASVELYLSYVSGRGMPKTSAGPRWGLGSTKARASLNAGHPDNHAPFEQFAQVYVNDAPGLSLWVPGPITARSAVMMAGTRNALVWTFGAVLRLMSSQSEKQAVAWFNAGYYASAWLAIYPAA